MPYLWGENQDPRRWSHDSGQWSCDFWGIIPEPWNLKEFACWISKLLGPVTSIFLLFPPWLNQNVCNCYPMPAPAWIWGADNFPLVSPVHRPSDRMTPNGLHPEPRLYCIQMMTFGTFNQMTFRWDFGLDTVMSLYFHESLRLGPRWLVEGEVGDFVRQNNDFTKFPMPWSPCHLTWQRRFCRCDWGYGMYYICIS